jgi:hypothetical protein
MQGVVRFVKKGKLRPRYVGPFQVSKRVNPLAYKVKLPLNLASIHDVFHVHDPSRVLSYEPLDIQANLTYEELPVQVLDRKEQQLRTKSIPLMKILWRNHDIEEASGELEQEMRDRYLCLFK